MKESGTAKVISITDLWKLFRKRLWIVILVSAAVTAGVFLIQKATYRPQYTSTATLYILRQDNSIAKTNDDADFSLALKVVSDCDYLLKSRSVLNQVIEELNIQIEYDDLSKMVSTNNPDNTRILEVMVVADTPQLAKQIVDKLCEIGQDKITEAMGFQQVNLYEYGNLDPEPSNRIRKITYVIVCFIAAVVTFLIIIAAYLLDDRIRSDAEIEKVLGLSLLGDIPTANLFGDSGYGHYSHYGKY